MGLLTKVLIIWFLCSYGAGILFAPMLNSFHIGGYPVGFFFAQQPESVTSISPSLQWTLNR